MENRNTSQTGSQSEDPRIDSPEIRVVYPSEPLKAIDPIKPKDPIKPSDPVQEIQTMAVAPSTAPTQTTSQSTPPEACTCKISWTDAIKQNVTPFLLLALGMLAVGYYIGKNK
jgi:hypothetical protein